MKTRRLEHWGKKVTNTDQAIANGVFNKTMHGICLGMTEFNHIYVVIEGRVTPRVYHPIFWKFDDESN